MSNHRENKIDWKCATDIYAMHYRGTSEFRFSSMKDAYNHIKDAKNDYIIVFKMPYGEYFLDYIYKNASWHFNEQNGKLIHSITDDEIAQQLALL